jgi:hypothetical protein
MYPGSHSRIKNCTTFEIFLVYLLKVNLNLFQVKGSPIPPPCHPRHSCTMSLMRCGFAAEMWPVHCLQCAFQTPELQNCDSRQCRQFSSYVTARAANVMAPQHLNSIGLFKNTLMFFFVFQHLFKYFSSLFRFLSGASPKI